ncbi:guanitoxin biosynthesis L-enduracididine beta-hydroxylase GntD [Streptomyces sparsus]
MLTTLDLCDDDLAAVHGLATEITRRHPSADDPELLRRARVLAHELPRTVREALMDLHASDRAATLVIGRHTVQDAELGPTPAHWSKAGPSSTSVQRLETILVLYSALLGDVFGWGTQQDGRLIHDVVPVAGHEQEQLGSGSHAPLMWHTEEAFHPHRADYVGLMCLRNPDGVATTVGGFDSGVLTDDELRCAFAPRFYIRPDNSHLRSHNPSADAGGAQFDRVEDMNTAPEAVPVLFGSPRAPFLQIDPAYMDTAPGDTEARRTLDRMAYAIESGLTDVTLRPGDIVFIDNYRVVHGRRPFHARYDGTDRWLKRVNVTRDLRKSNAARPEPALRVIA